MSPNKSTVTAYMEAFRASDKARVLACLTDDVVWEIPGQTRFEGKAAFEKEIVNPAFEPNPDIRVNRLLEDGDVVIAEGTVRTVSRFGEVYELAFCDLFEMREGKVARLVSYLAQTKGPE